MTVDSFSGVKNWRSCACGWYWWSRRAFKRFVQLHPVFPDKVAVVFAEPQLSVLRQVVRVLLWLNFCLGRFRTISHAVALCCKDICWHVQAAILDSTMIDVGYLYHCFAIRLQVGDIVSLVCWTQIGEPVLTVIPPAEGQVDPPDEGHRLVDGYHLLMVGPQQDHGRDVVRVPHHLADERVKSSNEDLKSLAQRLL